MMILSRIGVLSCGRILGGIYFLLGLIFGAIVSLVSMLGLAFGGPNEGQEATFFACSIIFFPLGYGIGGFLGGLLMAALYNISADYFGGLELHLTPDQEPTQE